MREGLIRAFWISLVVLAFCVPLFVGLGGTDVQNDEAIYSYGVDEILARGDWLNPRSSPNANIVFLEKPPLKFWMVAAPIRLGLLPHDEFGLRAVDALLGGIAFLYVLAIGWRVAGPLCGAVAVMALFVYPPLLFVHGIRGNNMEAPLVLAYCGGVYHWLAWTAARTTARRRGHILALALFFYLGFMTKFVAVLFLPVVLGLATLIHATPRRRLREDWQTWALAFGLFVLLAAPWFVYQQLVAGEMLWRVMFADHVYTRFTTSVDPGHLRPWNFYVKAVFTEFQRNGTYFLVLGGLAALFVRLGNPRRLARVEYGSHETGGRADRAALEAFVILAWFLVPIALMSMVTSKLHHYAYPFLPPLALAAGYAVVLLLGAVDPIARRAFAWVGERTSGLRRRPRLAMVLTTLAVIATTLAVITAASGPVRVEVPGIGLVRNSRIERPLMVATALFLVAGRVRGALGAAALLLVMFVSPVSAYRDTLTALTRTAHPLRSMRDCLLEARDGELRAGGSPRPVYAVAPDTWFLHPYFYYLRHVGGWEHVDYVDDRALAEALTTAPRPILIDNDVYSAFKARHGGSIPAPRMVTTDTALLLLPGPYAGCARAYTRQVTY